MYPSGAGGRRPPGPAQLVSIASKLLLTTTLKSCPWAGPYVCKAEPAHGQVCRLSADGLNVLLVLLAVAGLPLSSRHNAVYDLSDVLPVLVVMCEKNTFVRAAVEILRIGRHLNPGPAVPSARWFVNMFSRASPEEIEAGARRMFSESVDMLYRQRVIPRTITLAVDCHNIPYLGKLVSRLFGGGRRKGGTTRFETYMTAVAASLSYLPHVGIRVAGKGESMADGVASMIGDCRRAGIRVRRVLLDRGFYSVAVMAVLDRLGIWFIMPVPQRPPVRRAVDEYRARKRKRVSKYTVTSSTGETFEVTLIIVERRELVKGGKGKRKSVYLVYATNMPTGMARRAVKAIPSAYKERWAIETGYRCVEKIRARTKSNCAQARIFLFIFTMTANNVCAIENHAADIEGARLRKEERARTRAQRRAAARIRGCAGGGGLRTSTTRTWSRQSPCWTADAGSSTR